MKRKGGRVRILYSCVIVKLMQRFLLGFAAAFAVGGISAGLLLMIPKLVDEPAGKFTDFLVAQIKRAREEKKKSPEEMLAEALEKSKEIRGLYMTADVASDTGAGATRLRNHLVYLAETTEINGLVIDVKEVCGPDYNEAQIKNLLQELHAKNIWTIARIVVFKDVSQIEAHPDWYLKRESPIAVGNECWNKKHLIEKYDNRSGSTQIAMQKDAEPPLWRDKRGGYWLDPAHPEARRYILDFSKKMIDFGFDELQFDYIRFPSDGDVQNAIYPVWDGKTPKFMVLKSFFEFLKENLKEYKPDIILSVDLFGYAALRTGDVGIGQRLEDIGDNFDYISFMVYPSHYYNGLFLYADPARDLPAVNFNRPEARANPDVVVYRSLLAARDFLDGKIATSTEVVSLSEGTGTTTVEELVNPVSRFRARLRPWLEDFFHEDDQAAGRPYGVEKMRLQIEAAERVEKHGWLLWNAANVYTEEALKRE